MLALFLVATAVVVYRWDINISGLLVVMSYVPGHGITYTSYRPSLVEIVAGSAIVSYGLMAFSLGVKYLRVVDHSLVDRAHEVVSEPNSETVPA